MDLARARTIITGVTAALTAGAVIRELRRPKRKRNWHGRIAGVPYDFRRPTLKRLRKTLWAPRDPRIMMPRAFGIGWDPNLGRIWRLVTRS